MHRLLRGLTVAIVLASALVANPPPGRLLGLELTTELWAGLFAVAALAGLATVVAADDRWAYAAWGLMVLPLLGPAHEVFTVGFAAAALGAVAAVLHLELVSFAHRRTRWATLVADAEALGTYERMHRAAWLRLGLVLATGLAIVAGAYGLVLELTPPAFSQSLEARQVEGMAAIGLVAALLGLAIAALFHDGTPEEEAT